MSHKILAAKRAFTIFELMIVVLLIGILTAAAIPRFREGITKSSLNAACERVATDLKYARKHAETISNIVTMDLNVNPGNEYEITGLADISNIHQQYKVELDKSPYHSKIISANFDGEPVAEFTEFGMPASSGIVVLQSGGYQRSVELSANGIVTVHDIQIVVVAQGIAEAEATEFTTGF